MKIKIDKNIPLPNTDKYSLLEYEVGDSNFYIAKGLNIQSLRSYAARTKRTRGYVYKTEKRTENGIEGYRCWRIK